MNQLVKIIVSGGGTASMAFERLSKIPGSAMRMVLSVGGNDALIVAADVGTLNNDFSPWS